MSRQSSRRVSKTTQVCLMACHTASRGLPQTLVILDSAYHNLGEILCGLDCTGGLSVGVYRTKEGGGVQDVDGSDQRGDGSDQSKI
jgi:hypothetical protein